MNKEPKDILIAGAGLVGSLWAVFLVQKGHRVRMYEKRPDLRKADISAGRSINLALSDRGWKALETVGIAGQVREMAIPMYGRMIHNTDGHLTFLPYGMQNQAIYSVSRGGLNGVLMSAAEASGAETFFEQKVASVDLDTPAIRFEDGSRAQADIIFGADGAFSKVRASLLEHGPHEYSLDELEHGYKELSIPPGKSVKWLIEKNALHIWPRKRFMLIALPNMDGSFTCTLFAPFRGENSFVRLQTDRDVESFFEKYFPDALKVMPTLLEDWHTNPVSTLGTVRCRPWTYRDKVCLIGDAAHAIVPFYGQGMNAGFEDCTVLNDLIGQHGDDWLRIFSEYDASRKTDTDAIADLALQNFIEMRDRVADRSFLLRKEIEKQLHKLYPDEYMPLYSLVTFSHRPYSEALATGRREEKFFQEVLNLDELPESPSESDLETIMEQWRQFNAGSQTGNTE